MTGSDLPAGKLSLAEADWDGMELVACPAGHEPIHQQYNEDSGRFSFRMSKDHCGDCPHLENCFVHEKQKFYSYGFWDRKLVSPTGGSG